MMRIDGKTRILSISLFVVFLGLITLTLVYNIGTALTGYSYYQNVTLTGSTDGPVSNYHLRFDVYNTIGDSTGWTVFLNENSLSFPNDIRFINAAGTMLPYWIETGTSNATHAVLWVRVDSIAASPSNTVLGIFYGKEDDGGASSGVNTFPELFDEFTSNSFNDTWSVGAAMSATFSGENVTIQGEGDAYINSVTRFGVNKTVIGRAYMTSGALVRMGFCNDAAPEAFDLDIFMYGNPNAGTFNIDSWSGASHTGNAVTISDATHVYRVDRAGASKAVFWVDNNIIGTHTTDTPTTNIAAEANGRPSLPLTLDWIAVGNVTANPPTVNDYTEEASTEPTPTPAPIPPVADFSADDTTITAGTTVTFTDLSTNSPTSWSWSFGTGEGTSTLQNPTHQYNTAGTYTVSLEATNSDGSDTETKTGYIVVSAAPTPTPTPAPQSGLDFTATPTSGTVPLTVSFTSNIISPPASGLIVFLGDSITTDVGGGAFPTDIDANSSMDDYTISNKGVSGDKTYQMIARYPTDVTGQSPDYVSILAGINDIWIGSTPSQIETNLSTMYNWTLANNSKLIISPIMYGTSYNGIPFADSDIVDEIDEWIYDYYNAANHSNVLLVDFRNATRVQDNLDNRSFWYRYTSDGLHPNSLGAQVMADNWTDEFTTWNIGASDYDFQWDFGDVPFGTANNTLEAPTHQYNDTGSYTVTLTVNNSTSTSTLVKINMISVSSSEVGDVAYLQTLIDTNTTAGKTSVIPARTYHGGASNNTLYIPSNAVIIGDGYPVFTDIKVNITNNNSIIVKNILNNGSTISDEAFSVNGTCNNITFTNCSVNYSRTGNSCFNLYPEAGVGTTDIVYDNCSVSDSDGTGFMLLGDTSDITLAEDVYYLNCSAFKCGYTERANDYIVGFDLAEDLSEQSTLIVKDLYVYNCNASFSWESGFHMEPSAIIDNATIKDCNSINNSVKPSPMFGAGYMVHGATIENSHSKNNRRGIDVNVLCLPTPSNGQKNNATLKAATTVTNCDDNGSLYGLTIRGQLAENSVTDTENVTVTNFNSVNPVIYALYANDARNLDITNFTCSDAGLINHDTYAMTDGGNTVYKYAACVINSVSYSTIDLNCHSTNPTYRWGTYANLVTECDLTGSTSSTNESALAIGNSASVSVHDMTLSGGSLNGAGVYTATGTITIYDTTITPSTSYWFAHVYYDGLGAGSVTVNAPTMTYGSYRKYYGPINVNPASYNPPLTMSFAGTPTSGLIPLDVAFSPTITYESTLTGSINTYAYSYGDLTANGTTASPTHSYMTAGVYSVILTITNNGGSIGVQRTNYIGASAVVPPEITDFTATPTNGQAALSVSFSAITTGLIESYSWDFGDGYGSTEAEPTHTYNIPGSYNVKLIVSNAGGAYQKILNNYVIVNPHAPITTPTPTPAPTSGPITPTATPAPWVILKKVDAGTSTYTPISEKGYDDLMNSTMGTEQDWNSFDLAGIMGAVMSPGPNNLGPYFWILLFGAIGLFIYIKTDSVLIPGALYLLGAGLIGPLLLPEFGAVIWGLVIVGFAALGYLLFRSR
jgi:PKD repeat protein